MRVLFYYSNPDWSGTARAFASAGAGLAGRGYQVTFACAADSVVEQRLSQSPFEVIPLVGGESKMRESWRLRDVMLKHFVEVVFVSTDRDHQVAGGAMRLAGRGAVIRRVRAGERLQIGSGGRWGSRLAATGFLFSDAAEMQRAAPQ